MTKGVKLYTYPLTTRDENGRHISWYPFISKELQPYLNNSYMNPDILSLYHILILKIRFIRYIYMTWSISMCSILSRICFDYTTLTHEDVDYVSKT